MAWMAAVAILATVLFIFWKIGELIDYCVAYWREGDDPEA